MKGLVFTLIVIVSFLSANAQESTKKSSKSYKEEKQAEQIKKVSELVENKTLEQIINTSILILNLNNWHIF